MNDVEKRLEGYRRLIDIARDLASTLDLDSLLNRIVSAAVDLTEAEAASILLSCSSLFAVTTVPPSAQTAARATPPRDGSSSAAHADRCAARHRSPDHSTGRVVRQGRAPARL